MALLNSTRKPRLTWTSRRVVDPGHAEHDHALGLDDAVENLGLAILGVLVEHRHQGLDHLMHRLVELLLLGVLGDYASHEGSTAPRALARANAEN
jgi:hypothetical protein